MHNFNTIKRKIVPQNVKIVLRLIVFFVLPPLLYSASRMQTKSQVWLTVNP